MPGYFIHLASAPTSLRYDPLALKGFIAPDVWKATIPTYDEYEKFFNNCKDIRGIDYEQILRLCDLSHGGTHFGSNPRDTNHADFQYIYKMISNNQLLISSFLIAYIHHLRVDTMFYSRNDICDYASFKKDYAVNAEKAMDTLHLDWDKTNKSILNWYPELVSLMKYMPEDVKKVVQFTEGEPHYINLGSLKEFMDDFRHEHSIKQLIAGW